MNDRVTRHTVPLALACLMLLPGGCGPRASRAPAPLKPTNVLILVVDCLRADRLRASHPRPAATAMQKLAAAGTSFDLTFAQASWTRPSVTTLLTGLYPSEHGLGEFHEGAGQTSAQALAPGVLTLAEAMRSAGYSTALIGEQYQLSPTFGLDQGFDHYRYRAAYAGNIHASFLKWAADPAHRPFFAYLHYLEIDWPYCPPPVARGAFDPGESQLDLCANWRQLDRDIRSGAVALGDADRRLMAIRYDEEILALDSQLRWFFSRLVDLGLWDDTLIILTADHGEEFFEHASYGHGHTLKDELIHVPLVLKPPAAWRSPAGARQDFLVESRDIVATILDASGIRLAGEERGKSLVPWLAGEPPAAPPHEFVVSESNGMIALRTREWKLILHVATATEELYDLAHDPGETRNVASERPAELKALRARLQSWRQGLHRVGATDVPALDRETEEGLRQLGYVN